MPDPRPDADDWPDEPDAWAEADAAWRAKWADEAPDADDRVAPMAPASAPATASGVGRAYGDGMREAGPYLGLGVQIAASMALFVGGGLALDRWAGTGPWGVLAGAALGLAAIIALLVRLVKLMDAGDPTRTARPGPPRRRADRPGPSGEGR